MRDPVILIGVGEMGGVFARGLLRLGHPVYPVTRDMDMQVEAAQLPQPAMVLLAVAEKDLQPTLAQLPAAWYEHLALLQNELLPRDWQQHGLDNPTVISVWFEKKKGQDARVLIPSPVHGPRADLLINALATLDIPAYKVTSAADMEFELVLKNVYILTTNIAGLVTGGTVNELWQEHQKLARQVANDVMDIQDWLTGKKHDRDRLCEGMLQAFEGDPEHKCMGRSAPARLQRALEIADEANLEVPHLRNIARDQG
jgi:hypothetical protein